MSYFQTLLPSPVGPIQLIATDTHLTHLMWDKTHLSQVAGQAIIERDDHPILAQARHELEAYFAGRTRDFTVPVQPAGTAFQQSVWQALRSIPYGESISYGELARRVGNPLARRAVGAANGCNPISIIFPCHRVIGADLRLTGYGGGLPIKEWLLRHEGLQIANGRVMPRAA